MGSYSYRSKKKTEEFEALLVSILIFSSKPDIPISLYLLKRAGIVPTGMTHGNALSTRISRFVADLKYFGFIEDFKTNYLPGSYQKRYKPNRWKIYQSLGEEQLAALETRLRRLPVPQMQRPSGIEEAGALLGKCKNDLSWNITSPGIVEFRRGSRLVKRVDWERRWKKQVIHLSAFQGNTEAFEAWSESLEAAKTRIPEDVQEWLRELNEDRSQDTHIRFNVRIKSNISKGKGTKLYLAQSSRATSSFCNTESDGPIRHRVLERLGLTQSWDIPSCVPRVDYLLARGVWLPPEIDLYKLIYAMSGLPREWNDELRANLKKVFMRLRFGASSGDGWNKYSRHCRKEKELPVWSESQFLALHAAMVDLLSVGQDTSVFFWESILELDVLRSLQARGHIVLNVYDGFYFKENLSKDELEKVVEEAAYRLKSRFDSQEVNGVIENFPHSNVDISMSETWCRCSEKRELNTGTAVELAWGKCRALVPSAFTEGFLHRMKTVFENLREPVIIQSPTVTRFTDWAEHRKKELKELGMTVYVATAS